MPPRPPRRRARRLPVLAVVACALVVALAAPAPAAPAAPLLRPPVDAPVVDPFRPPADPWSPGNRGLEYATVPGAAVLAPASGRVVFAGPVASTRHVTVRDALGLKVTVSFLASVDVVTGQRVRAGEVLGTAGRRLHLSVRDGERYLDPAPLLASAGERPQARLVRDDLLAGDGPAAARAEAALLAELERQLPSRPPLGALVRAVPVLAALLDASGAAAPSTHVLRLAGALLRWDDQRHRCTPADVAPAAPSERRLAVRVGGLGSSSAEAGIDRLDLGALGYDPADVVRSSYEGGRVPGAVGPSLAHLPVSAYEPSATQRDVSVAADHLVELLVAIGEAEPGVPIDVFAHSQGGIVVRAALADGRLPAAVDHVVTIATPHGGADLATDLVALRSSVELDVLLPALEPLTGYDLTAASPTLLAEGSPTLATLPLPPASVRFLAIGARGDAVVPAPRSGVPGRAHVVVPTAGPTAHQQVVGAAATRREVALALAGLPPGCESLADAVADALVADLVVSGEDLLGGGVAALAAVVP